MERAGLYPKIGNNKRLDKFTLLRQREIFPTGLLGHPSLLYHRILTGHLPTVQTGTGLFMQVVRQLLHRYLFMSLRLIS